MKRSYQQVDKSSSSIEHQLPLEIWTNHIIASHLGEFEQLKILSDVCTRWREVVTKVPVLIIEDFDHNYPFVRDFCHIEDLELPHIVDRLVDVLYNLRVFLNQNSRTLRKLALSGHYEGGMPHLYLGSSISNIAFIHLKHIDIVHIEFHKVEDIVNILTICKDLVHICLKDIYVSKFSSGNESNALFQVLGRLDDIEHLDLDIYLRKESQLQINSDVLFPKRVSKLRCLYLYNQCIDNDFLSNIGRRCPYLVVLQFDANEAYFSIEGIINLLKCCPMIFSIQLVPVEGESTFKFRPGDMRTICNTGKNLREIRGYDKFEYTMCIQTVTIIISNTIV